MQQDLLNNTLRAGLSQIGIDLNAPIAPHDPRLKGHTWGEFVTELLASLQDRPGLLMVLDRLAAHVQLSTMKSSFENPRLASLLGEASRSLWNITVGDFEDLLNEMLRQNDLKMDDLTEEDILAMFTQFEKLASEVTLSFVEEFSAERSYRLIRIRH